MKKGFTLIELLAVIVILAIIALIATPIVLSIIADANESATIRSGEYYLGAVEQSLSTSMLLNGNDINGTHTIMEDANICIGIVENNKCIGEKINVEVKGEIPKGGNVVIRKGKIEYATLDYENDKVIKNYDGKVVKVLDKMCTLVSDADSSKTITAGDKYTCEVKEGTSFNFYVLNTPTDENINLIIERDICEDGTVATTKNKCRVAWIKQIDYELAGGTKWSTEEDRSYYGPVTAMNHTYKATKDITSMKKY